MNDKHEKTHREKVLEKVYKDYGKDAVTRLTAHWAKVDKRRERERAARRARRVQRHRAK